MLGGGSPREHTFTDQAPAHVFTKNSEHLANWSVWMEPAPRRVFLSAVMSDGNPLKPSLRPGVFPGTCDGESAIAVRRFHQAAYGRPRNVVALGDLRQGHPRAAVKYNLLSVHI